MKGIRFFSLGPVQIGKDINVTARNKKKQSDLVKYSKGGIKLSCWCEENDGKER